MGHNARAFKAVSASVPLAHVGCATIRGPYHERLGLRNQDALAYYFSNEAVAVAVADGLGSCSQSHEGSTWAAHVAVRICLQEILRNRARPCTQRELDRHKRQIVGSWRARFGQQYQQRDSTLCFVTFTGDRLLLGQIGDGLILCRERNEGSAVQPFYEMPKEFLNSTFSLAHPDALELLQVLEINCRVQRDYEAFILMTDGTADDLSDHDLFSRDLLRELSRRQAPWDSLLSDLLRAWPTPGSHDDKTMAVVSLCEGDTQAAPSVSDSDAESGEPTAAAVAQESETRHQVSSARGAGAAQLDHSR